MTCAARHRFGPAARQRRARAFTLMEIMLALATSAIVLAGIGGVFFSAMRLRERTAAVVDESAALHQALSTLRRDLLGAVPPGGLLAGDFQSGLGGSLGVGDSYWIRFSTTTGRVDANAPWGDLQEVSYELRPSTRPGQLRGSELVRTLSRNLLTTTQLEVDDQLLLENVESLEIACYDGLQWRESWDTSLYQTNLPSAVRLRISMLADEEEAFDQRQREPIELIIPLVSQPRAEEAGAMGEGEEETP